MKGQFTWDYIVSIVAFIVLVSYLSLQVINNAPNMTNAIRSEFLRSEAYQISELLINDPGEPRDWQTVVPPIANEDPAGRQLGRPSRDWQTVVPPIANLKRAGLASESLNLTNYISSAKVARLNAICTPPNYASVASSLGVDMAKYNFSLIVSDRSTGSILISGCTPPVTIVRAVNITMKRYAAMDSGGYAELILQAW